MPSTSGRPLAPLGPTTATSSADHPGLEEALAIARGALPANEPSERTATLADLARALRTERSARERAVG